MATKFSDMASATDVSNSDQVVGLQAGVDTRMTKAQFLIGGAGENIALEASSGNLVSLLTPTNQASVVADDTGNVGMFGNLTVTVSHVPTGNNLTLNAAGNIVLAMTTASAGRITIGDAANDRILLDMLNRICFITALNGFDASCVTGVAGSWAFPPTSHQNAQDRIAVALAGVLGFPIP